MVGGLKGATGRRKIGRVRHSGYKSMFGGVDGYRIDSIKGIAKVSEIEQTNADPMELSLVTNPVPPR